MVLVTSDAHAIVCATKQKLKPPTRCQIWLLVSGNKIFGVVGSKSAKLKSKLDCVGCSLTISESESRCPWEAFPRVKMGGLASVSYSAKPSCFGPILSPFK